MNKKLFAFIIFLFSIGFVVGFYFFPSYYFSSLFKSKAVATLVITESNTVTDTLNEDFLKSMGIDVPPGEYTITFKPGTVITGPDKNKNGIPDVAERYGLK
jgi:hypothetical protein